MENKVWYQSKTLWTNFVAFVGVLLMEFGVIDVELSPETVATILIVINFALRLITGKQLTTTK